MSNRKKKENEKDYKNLLYFLCLIYLFYLFGEKNKT